MALQALAAGERGAQLLDDSGLVLGEAVGVVPIDRGEGRPGSLYLTPSTMTVPRSRSIRCRRLRSSRPNEGFRQMSRLYLELDDSAMAFWIFSVRRVSASESPGLPFRAKAVQGSFA